MTIPISDVLVCSRCRSPLLYVPGSPADCGECRTQYVERHGILDLLGVPSEPVTRELRGLASENGIDFDSVGAEGVKYLRVETIESTSELMDGSRNEPIQYYQQTASAYFEALARAEIDAHMVVAEVGAERTLWKLRVIEELCDLAFAVNIFFHVGGTPPPPTKAVKLLGDMNKLPFESSALDLLIYSATIHHSSEMASAFKEMARVLRPGGRAIVINEPVAGLAKALGGAIGHSRDEDIHEDAVTFRTWNRALDQSGLQADHFVPAWFLTQIRRRSRMPVGTRFRRLGSFVAPFARRSAVGDVVRATARVPGQALLGLPLNAVLWKPARAS